MRLFVSSHRVGAGVVGLAALALSLALVAGCGGSRVDHERVVAAGNGGGQAAVAGGAVADVPAAVDPAVTGTQSAADPAAGAPVAAAPGASAPGAAPAVAGRTAEAAAGQRKAPGAKSPAASAVSSSAACEKALTPIRLGQVTTTSGLVGSSIGGIRTGVQVWASDVNSRGGVQCHPVEVTSLDDGSDSSRVSANWNQVIKVKGAVACIGCGNPIPMAALRTAAERDKIPVVGGDLTAMDWFRSEWLFPQGGTALSSYDGGFIEGGKAAKGGVAGLFWCVEASICTDIKANIATSMARSGLTTGPIKAISLTQPDFTAECKTMKDAGVTVLFVAADGAGIARVARSCASLGYRPVLASGSIGTPGSAGADPSLQQNELYLGTPVMPYLATDSPAVVEWQAAMKKFAPNQALEQSMIIGWSAGKLFEAALAKVAGKARAGNVTTEMVLEGLWQIKDEKLGGLSPGVSFAKGTPATYVDCYYTLKITRGGFAAPTGKKVSCYKPGSNTLLAGAGSGAQAVGYPAAWAGLATYVAPQQRDDRRRRRGRVRACHV